MGAYVVRCQHYFLLGRQETAIGWSITRELCLSSWQTAIARIQAARGALRNSAEHIELRVTGLQQLSRQEVWECLQELSGKVTTTLLHSKDRLVILLDRDQLRSQGELLADAVEQLRAKVAEYSLKKDLQSRSAVLLEQLRAGYLERRAKYL